MEANNQNQPNPAQVDKFINGKPKPSNDEVNRYKINKLTDDEKVKFGLK